MASKTLALVGVILTFCVLFYAILWINLSVNLKSFSQGLKDLVRAEFLGREIHQHIDDRATINKPIITSALNFSSLEDAIDPKKQSVEREDDITPIPILYKKNFTKLPVWDFEDVYLQDNDARKPICSDSKSIHNTKDPNFKKGFLPNIQLWLYRGQLNITEWNRLAHFNNPFGFMEYKYDEIKPAVNLIPKPKLKLLPVPESAKDGCIRCAVVGSSGILNNSKLGKEIDSHDYVFRVNGALTHGYEEDVGNKTSVYVHTAFSLHSSLNAFKKTGFQRILQNENTKYVMIPEGLRDFQWLQGLLQGIEATGHYKGVRPLDYFNGTFNESRFYVLHPDFLRYVRYRFMLSEQTHTKHWAIYRPTNGAFALFLALHTCDIVDVYGYITEDHQKYSNYYYEKLKSRVIFYINHDYPLEIKTWKNLHDSGIIQLYQGKGDLNNTKT